MKVKKITLKNWYGTTEINIALDKDIDSFFTKLTGLVKLDMSECEEELRADILRDVKANVIRDLSNKLFVKLSKGLEDRYLEEISSGISFDEVKKHAQYAFKEKLKDSISSTLTRGNYENN